MADTSRNPEDIASMNRLASELKGASSELANQVRQDRANLTEREQLVRQEAAQEESFVRRIESAAAETRGVRGGLGGGGSIGEAAASVERAATPQLGEAQVAQLRAVEQKRIASLQELANAESKAAQTATAAERVQQRVAPTATPPVGPGATSEAEPGVSQLRAQTAALNETVAAKQRSALSSKDWSAAAREDARDLGLLSNAYRDHGALTAEFIEAARKGQVGMQELGYQVSTTIAKFAGWTAAAGAVYAVVGAFSRLKDGAVESQSGVANLSRFIDGLDVSKAVGSFNSLSRQLNVSIKDAAEAESAFARIFHNLPDTVTAARVSLLATKLDNISLADSYRYLTSLTQEYGLQASQLPGVFDQISAAQRQLGARVSDTLPALARSAAAIKNAGGGGDPSQLIALLSTTEVATGQTGTSVGTAFYRGASRFFPQAANQDLIKSYGIDTTNFTQALIDAITKATNTGLDGPGRRALSQAFFGPQFGGRFAGIFDQGSRLETALQKTSPQAAAGSAEQELRDKLKGADEVLKSFGNTIERLGAELAQSGALDPLLAIVKLFGVAGHAVADLVKDFHNLLGSLGDIPAGIAEAVIAIRTLRRFDVGAGTNLPILRRNPVDRERTAALTGLDDETAFFNQQRKVATQQKAILAQRITSIEQQITAETELNGESEKAATLRQRQVALEAQYNAAIADQTAADALLARTAQARTAVKGGSFRTPEQVRAAAGASPVGAASTAEADVAAGAAAGTAAAAVNDVERTASGIGPKLKAASARMSEGAAAFAEQAEVSGAFIAGPAGAKVGGAAGKVATGFASVGESLTNLATASVGLGEVMIAAFITFEILKSLGNKANKTQTEGYNKLPLTNTQADAADQYNKSLSGVLGGGTILGSLAGADQNNKAAYDAQLADIDAATRGKDQATAILGQINAKLRAAAKGNTGQQVAGLQAALSALANDTLLQELDPTAYQKARDALLNHLKKFQDSRPDANPFLQDTDPKDTLASLQSLTDQAKIGSGISSGGDLNRFIQGFETVTFKYKNDPAYAQQKNALKNVEAAQQEAINGIKDTIQKQLQVLQDSTYDPSKLASGYQQISDEIKAKQARIGVQFNALAGQLGDAEKKLADLQKQRADTPNAPAKFFGLGGIRIGVTPTDTLDLQIKEQQATVDRIKKALASTQQGNKALADELLNLQHSLTETEFSNQSKQIEDQAALQASTATSKAQEDAIEIRKAGQLVALALKDFGANSLQYLEAVANANKANATAAQDALALIQLQGQLATSQIQTLGPAGDLARLRSELSTAQKSVAAAQAEANNPNKQSDIINAQIRVNDLNRQIAEAVITQAQNTAALARQIYDAQQEIKIAGLNDPLAIAKANLAKDLHDLQSIQPGQFTTQQQYLAAYYQQLAKVAQDRKTVQQSIISKDIENAQFEHNIGQLSDQAYIAQLQQILKLKSITTEQKHQLLTEIYNLQHAKAGELELNVGNISLPSIYQIRQAILGGRAGGGSNVQVNHTASVTVNVEHAGDVQTVTGALDKALGTSVTSAARAAGII